MQVVSELCQLIVWFFPPHGWKTRPKVVNSDDGRSTLELYLRQPAFTLEDVGQLSKNLDDPLLLAKLELRKKMKAKVQVYRIPLPVPVYAEREFVVAKAFQGQTGTMKLADMGESDVESV